LPFGEDHVAGRHAEHNSQRCERARRGSALLARRQGGHARKRDENAVSTPQPGSREPGLSSGQLSITRPRLRSTGERDGEAPDPGPACAPSSRVSARSLAALARGLMAHIDDPLCSRV
jgi:hypothetical protein